MEGDKLIAIDGGYLAGILQRVLGKPIGQSGEPRIERIKGGLELASTIYRLIGSAEVAGETINWSLILKVVRSEAQFTNLQDYHYWQREALAYQSGQLEFLPGGVKAPLCYDVHEHADGSIWIWLEDVRDERTHPWSIEVYAHTANCLGQFNGAYLAGRPLPADDWITHDWLRKYLEHATPMVDFIRWNPANPAVQSLLPGLALLMTLAMWDERECMLRMLDNLPQTFCHQDAFERNLFQRGDQVIALDWSFAGIAPVGAELAPLVGVAFGLAGYPSSQAKELDQACFTAYLEGLRQAGWNPDPRKVRLGYTLTVTLRYVLGATVGELLPGLLDDSTRQHWAEGIGTTPEKAMQTDADIAAYYQSIAVEAMKLLGLGFTSRFIGRTLWYSIRTGGKRRANRL